MRASRFDRPGGISRWERNRRCLNSMMRSGALRCGGRMGVPCGVSDDRCHRYRFHTQGRRARSWQDASQRAFCLPTWRRTPWMEEVGWYTCGVGEVSTLYMFLGLYCGVCLQTFDAHPDGMFGQCRRLLPRVSSKPGSITCALSPNCAWEAAESWRLLAAFLDGHHDRVSGKIHM